MNDEAFPQFELTSEKCLSLVEDVFDGKPVEVNGKEFKLDLPKEELDKRKEFLKKLNTAHLTEFQSGTLANEFDTLQQTDSPPRFMINDGVEKREGSLYGGAWRQLRKEAADQRYK